MSSKILILANHDVGLYNFRKELLKRLVSDEHKVIVSCPPGTNLEKIRSMGCTVIETEMNRHGTNIFEEIKLMRFYRKLYKKVKPDIIFSYTIKPNIYGAMIAKKYSIPFVPNVTGLGTAVQNPGIKKNIIINLYKRAFTKVQTVFFQNETNREFFKQNNIALNKHKLLPGSGVNLSDFTLIDYPEENENINFVYISRVMKDKGIEEYLNAAKYIKETHENVCFHIYGFLDGDYKEILTTYNKKGIIHYHGMTNDIKEVFKTSHCIVHPSYHEGMSNVLLESAASGRPVLASNIPGCKEIFEEGISGIGFEPRDADSLIKAIEKFITLSHKEKESMGIAGRKKVEKDFNREIVIEKYLKEIELAVEGKYNAKFI